MEFPFDNHHHQHPLIATGLYIISILLAIWSKVSANDIYMVCAIISALLGARYFYYAGKVQKQLLEKNKSTTP